MPAIEAARSVALREIARVTNDPKLSGSLTDSARQEVSAFSPENATLPQIKNVVKVLQNDMANVHSSLAAQKADIGGRLGIKTPQAGAEGSSGLIYARDPQGKLHMPPRALLFLPAGNRTKDPNEFCGMDTHTGISAPNWPDSC